MLHVAGEILWESKGNTPYFISNAYVAADEWLNELWPKFIRYIESALYYTLRTADITTKIQTTAKLGTYLMGYT